jgi:hypothetical protein
LGWRPMKSEQMDNQKVDSTFRLGRAEIDIQLKSSKLKAGRWNWNVFSPRVNRREKEIEFYKQPYDFLFLAGLYFEEIDSLDPTDSIKYAVKRAEIQRFALIPGKVVLDYFAEKSPHARVLSLSRKKLLEGKYLELNEYFGTGKICSLLENTKKQQEEEQEFLEARRERKAS